MRFNISDIPQAESGGVHSSIDGPAGPFYRREITLQINTIGNPDAIEIVTETVQFSAEFTPETHDILEDDGPIPMAASEQRDDDTVVFRLDRPRKIKTICLKSNDGYSLAPNGNALTPVNAGVVVWACAARPDVDISIQEKRDITGMEATQMAGYNNLQLFRMDGDAMADEATVTAQSGSNLADVFIAQDVAVTRQHADGTPAPLLVEDVLSIEVESIPTGPRIGLPAPIDGDASTVDAYFWQIPGEVTETDRYNAANETAGIAFADTLQRYLDSWLAQHTADAVPENLTIPLMIDSDAPCHNELTVSFDYFLVRDGFSTDDGSPRSRKKKVLKFNGTPGQTHAIMVSAPKHSTITSAVMKMDVSFGAPPPTPVSRDARPLGTMSGKGVHIGVDLWAAQQVVVTEALTLTGISIGVMGIEKNTRLSVSLRGDNQGRPDGQILGQQEVSLATTGRKQYIQVPFNDVISLTNPGNWLLVKAVQGAAVWLTDDAPQNQMILSQVTTSGGVSQKRTSLTGVCGLYTFFSLSSPDSQSHSPLSLTVGNSVSLEQTEGSLLQADEAALKNGLNSRIGSPTSDCIVHADNIDIPLFFKADVKGVATVYPPKLTYE